MLIDCIIWILAIYGFLNICINVFFQIIYKDIDLVIKINKKDNLEFIIRTMLYKLWYFKNIIYINNSNDRESCDIIKKIEDDFGIKIINMR